MVIKFEMNSIVGLTHKIVCIFTHLDKQAHNEYDTYIVGSICVETNLLNKVKITTFNYE